jgi:DNA-binding CsgD family transcriptional regulator
VSDLLASARDGRSGVLVLRGEAGIGKSALVDWASAQAEAATVLRASGVESESQLAFSTLHDLFRPVADRIAEIPEPQAAALAGALAIGPPHAADRFTICAATLSLLAAAAEASTLVAIVDDAHWADASSLEALLFAARRLDAEGVALVFAVRDGVATPLDAAGLTELRVDGLEREAAAELLVGHGAAPTVAEELWAATGGNPLALLELPPLLTDAQLRGESPLPSPLPAGPSLERVYAARIEELPEPVRRALAVLAAADPGTGALAGALDSLGVAGDLATAESAGIVTVVEGVVQFRHPLLRSAAYHAATPAERRVAHGALADASTGDDSAERRAWHRAAAAAAPDEDVASGLVETALVARRRGAHAAAAGAFERASRLTSDDETRARRLLDAADDHRRSSNGDQAIELLREALTATSDPLLRADIQHLHGALETWRGDPLAAHFLLVAAAHALGELEPRKAAMMLADASWPCYLGGDIARGVETAERACAMAQRADGSVRMLTAVMLAQGLILQGDTGRGRELLDRARPLLEQPETVRRAPELVQAAAHVSIWLEELSQARRLLGLVVDAARAESSPGALPYALAIASELDFRTGNWAGAYAQAAEALRLAQDTGHANGLAFSLVGLARVEAAQGREAECRAHAGRTMQLAAFGVRAMVVYSSAVLGHLELALGRSAEAIEHLEQVARGVERQGIGEPAVVPWAADLVEALLRAGRRQDAERALERLELQAQATGGRWASAAAARCQGLLAPDEEVDETFGRALELHERTIGPFERARTLLCYGERLRRERRRTDAREPLRSALEVFERLAAAPWAERARTELEATGEQLRRGDEPASRRLTPQELQVALVVARGATNREAGAALFLSPKTIETHLGRVYRKVGVRSRTELAALLARDGALEEAVAA